MFTMEVRVLDPRKLLALVLGACVLVAEGVLLALGWGPFDSEAAEWPYFLMILAGGPACLFFGTLLGLRWFRTAGVLLWLGGAVEALGIALTSGAMVGRYFLGLGLFVVPQILAGTLFLLLARDSERRPPHR